VQRAPSIRRLQCRHCQRCDSSGEPPHGPRATSCRNCGNDGRRSPEFSACDVEGTTPEGAHLSPRKCTLPTAHEPGCLPEMEFLLFDKGE
jgi:hypothetical protein